MHLPTDLVPPVWAGLANLGLAAVLWRALRAAPWRFLDEPPHQHRFYAATLLLVLLWQMRAGIAPGLELHLLGMTALTLVFGWRLAVLSGTLAAALTIAIGEAGWWGLGGGALIAVALPVAITRGTAAVTSRLCPANVYVQTWLDAFFGGMVAAAGSHLALIGLAAAVPGAANPATVLLPVVPLLVFPEGFINGAVLTAILLYRPRWIVRPAEEPPPVA